MIYGRRAVVAAACGALGAFGGACAAGPGARANATDGPVDAPVARVASSDASDGAPREGIGLGSFDAGADAHWVEVDAAAFRGKKTVGRIAPEKIQAVVRANFGAFRTCYENELRTSPNLQGRVTVKFVIDVDGRVTTAGDERSELVDAKVVDCVVEAIRKLQFPRPEGGGIVTVIYPIPFSPGD